MDSSMYQTLKLRKPERFAKQLPKGVMPTEIEWGSGAEPCRILFSDGRASSGSCIRCSDPPCMLYSREELELEVFRDFPADRNDSVCPSGAIVWPPEARAPLVNGDMCVMCGICVSRCPVRAIHLDARGAHINDAPNEHFQLGADMVTGPILASTIETFANVPEEGIYLLESDGLLGYFREHLDDVARNSSMQFPNHLARNLLIAVGIGAAMRRQGDTNIRMDLVLGPPGVSRGTAEVELGSGVLDAPRNLLDNVAVLVARYEMDQDTIVPLVVSLDLPNQRSEYWRVIKDVRQVLGFKIQSITIGALAVTVWNRSTLAIRTGEELYLDEDGPSLRLKLENVLGRRLNVRLGYAGFVESSK